MHSMLAGPASISDYFTDAIYKVAILMPECDADVTTPVCVSILVQNKVWSEPDARQSFRRYLLSVWMRFTSCATV